MENELAEILFAWAKQFFDMWVKDDFFFHHSKHRVSRTVSLGLQIFMTALHTEMIHAVK